MISPTWQNMSAARHTDTYEKNKKYDIKRYFDPVDIEHLNNEEHLLSK